MCGEHGEGLAVSARGLRLVEGGVQRALDSLARGACECRSGVAPTRRGRRARTHGSCGFAQRLLARVGNEGAADAVAPDGARRRVDGSRFDAAFLPVDLERGDRGRRVDHVRDVVVERALWLEARVEHQRAHHVSSEPRADVDGAVGQAAGETREAEDEQEGEVPSHRG